MIIDGKVYIVYGVEIADPHANRVSSFILDGGQDFKGYNTYEEARDAVVLEPDQHYLETHEIKDLIMNYEDDNEDVVYTPRVRLVNSIAVLDNLTLTGDRSKPRQWKLHFVSTKHSKPFFRSGSAVDALKDIVGWANFPIKVKEDNLKDPHYGIC